MTECFRYALTDAGLELAEALEKAQHPSSQESDNAGYSSSNDLVIHQNERPSTISADNKKPPQNNLGCKQPELEEQEAQLCLRAGTYEICLLVDVAETNSK